LAEEMMRKELSLKAAKKADRVAAEGIIAVAINEHGAVMVEVNSETDFVARGDEFKGFADEVANTSLTMMTDDIQQLNVALDAKRQALVSKLGENLQIRRVTLLKKTNGLVSPYLHGGRIGVLMQLQGGNEGLAKDLAMHVAASRPQCVSAENVSPEILAKEKEIYMAQVAQSGKPANIIEKMVEGKLKKFLEEVTLLGQPFVKNPDETVAQLLQKEKATAVTFVRYEVGEGIEKKVDNFVEEVMSQVRGS